jgi:hypothetical protein
MNLVGLVNHGIDVIFTFAPIMRARVFILTLVWSAIAAFNLCVIIYLKISGKTTPGWATTSIFSIFQIHILLMIAFAILINITKKDSPNNVKFTHHEK